mmetsp:Transcript_12747/g.17563  ORF Transcript_12747/g.17563 Transcript_12747/m.17563 type:complete len:114 (+) Transcript_12747:80-421(+)
MAEGLALLQASYPDPSISILSSFVRRQCSRYSSTVLTLAHLPALFSPTTPIFQEPAFLEVVTFTLQLLHVLQKRIMHIGWYKKAEAIFSMLGCIREVNVDTIIVGVPIKVLDL